MGTRTPQRVEAAIDGLREVVDSEGLPYGVRLRIARAVKRAIVPRRKPGPKSSRLNAAYQDYRAGLRGLDLSRKHIPGHDKLSQWRRRAAERRLQNALHKRASRDRQRRKHGRAQSRHVANSNTPQMTVTLGNRQADIPPSGIRQTRSGVRLALKGRPTDGQQQGTTKPD